MKWYCIASLLMMSLSNYAQVRVVVESIVNKTPYNLILKDQQNNRINLETQQTYEIPIIINVPEYNKDYYIGIFNGSTKIADLLTYVIAYGHDPNVQFKLELNRPARMGGYDNIIKLTEVYPREKLLNHEESWTFKANLVLMGEKLEKSTMKVVKETKQRR
ncbi:hypothetical protein Noda2021_06020 [Candidatus Dependentiae bacterium Noda2021]|nr:hypothetical protein Noda2021_06020 [Candidatus Dependentiae bacterium Noda2021]